MADEIKEPVRTPKKKKVVCCEKICMYYVMSGSETRRMCLPSPAWKKPWFHDRIKAFSERIIRVTSYKTQ